MLAQKAISNLGLLPRVRKCQRTEANDLRARANTLQEDQNNSVAEIAALQAKIAGLQENIVGLTRELDAERNKHLQQIAVNTQRRKSEAEVNAEILRKYLGRSASVSESHGTWGGGAVIAAVNENDIVTLFVPVSYNNSQSYGQLVRCDKLHVVEVPKDGCDVQISIIERYGTPTTYGEARSWEERNVKPTHAGMKRGENVFSAQHRKEGSPKLRNIYVYASADGSPNYIMVTTEDGQEAASLYGSQGDAENKFAVLQLEWIRQGYRWIGGSGNGTLNMFTKK